MGFLSLFLLRCLGSSKRARLVPETKTEITSCFSDATVKRWAGNYAISWGRIDLLNRIWALRERGKKITWEKGHGSIRLLPKPNHVLFLCLALLCTSIVVYADGTGHVILERSISGTPPGGTWRK